MANRVELNEESLDKVVGGALTYRWRKSTKGWCGIDGDYSYAFDDKGAFEDMLYDCMQNQGMTDRETLDAMLDAGIIYPR